MLRAAVIVLMLAAPAFAWTTASDAQAQPVAAEDIEALAATIEDETKRAELLAHLRALIAASKGTGDEEVSQSLGPRMITGLSETAAEASRQLVSIADRFTDVPILIDWIKSQATDTASRTAWLIALLKLAAILAVGWAAERLGRLLLSRPRKAVESREIAAAWARVPLLLLRTVLDILPLLAFAVAAYATLPLVNPGAKVQVMMVTFVQAFFLARAMLILMRMLLVPAVPNLRVLPLSGVVANYLFIWSRRLISVGIYGYFIAEAAYFLGLPSGGRAGLMRLVGLLVTTMLVVFILQNRAQVSHWAQNSLLRGRDARDRRARLIRWVSDVWHVLAIVYVVAAYLVWAFDLEGGFAYLFRSTVVSVVILGAAKLISTGLHRAVERGFAVRADLRAKFPTLEARVNRYVPVIHLTLRSVLFVIVGIALLQTWGIDVLAALASSAGQRVVGSLFSIGIVAIAALILWEGVSTAIERYLSQTDADGNIVERGARVRTLLPLLRNAILVVLVIMVVLIVLSEFGINIGPLLAGAGVVGLAVGFGSQKLVQDVITGIFILLEDTISVGDVVTAGGMTGVVERLSIRSIRLRDLSGNVYTIPFSSVDTVTNMTKEFSMAVIEAGVAYRESVDDVMVALEQLGTEIQEDEEFGPLILEPLEMLGVDALADSAVVIKCRFKTVPLKQWAVRREFNRRMKNRFDELGIEIPFPHQTLYFGADKDGTAPPAFVKTERERRKGGKKAKADKPREPEVSEQDAPTPVDLPSEGDA